MRITKEIAGKLASGPTLTPEQADRMISGPILTPEQIERLTTPQALRPESQTEEAVFQREFGRSLARILYLARQMPITGVAVLDAITSPAKFLDDYANTKRHSKEDDARAIAAMNELRNRLRLAGVANYLAFEEYV